MQEPVKDAKIDAATERPAVKDATAVKPDRRDIGPPDERVDDETNADTSKLTHRQD